MKMFFVLLLFAGQVFAGGTPNLSGPLKVFKGPEGELIGMIEVNDSKEMLVYFKNLGGELEGKTKLYLFRDEGRGRKSVYFNKKKGSKTREYHVLVGENGKWQFQNPVKYAQKFSLTYSEAHSEKLKLEDVLKAYKPTKEKP